MNTAARWRLVLGRFADASLRRPLHGREARVDAALEYLYAREYRGRGVRDRAAPGTLDASLLTVPLWLGEVRELFPRDVVEVVTRHALERYGLTELVTDKETLERLEPSTELLKALLTFRGQLHEELLDTARRIIRQVVEDLRRRLETDVRSAFNGRRNLFRHGPQRVARNFDWRSTLRRNLRHYDPRRRRLVVQDPRFFARNARHLPWEVVLCIDQSGSMSDSVIHGAVMAGIFAGLPLLRTKLVVFDTSIVDLSDRVDDPVEVLMSVQLGGGTNIGQALAYAESRLENPHRAVVVLISDFCEGASVDELLRTCRRLREGGVTLLGLAALDAGATPVHDRQTAERLAEAGMEIAALTPNHFAGWLARVVHSR